MLFQLWEISSGNLLCTFHFDSSITSTVMDNAESRLFAGATNGSIYQVNMYEKVRKNCRVNLIKH